MAKDSAIEWCDATWNPWMGCTKVSAGCKNCYMFRDQRRFGHDPKVIRRSKTKFKDPEKWMEPLFIFVCSWSDFFHEDVPRKWLYEAWFVMLNARIFGHTFLLLTKRPENIADRLPFSWDTHQSNRWDHIWLGISAEDQATYDERLPHLLKVRAARRFISAEPLLGPIDLHLPKFLIDWVIVGGESGFNARHMGTAWALDLHQQCDFYKVPFFFKQWGGDKKIDGAWGGRVLRDHKTWDERPEPVQKVIG